MQDPHPNGIAIAQEFEDEEGFPSPIRRESWIRSSVAAGGDVGSASWRRPDFGDLAEMMLATKSPADTMTSAQLEIAAAVAPHSSRNTDVLSLLLQKYAAATATVNEEIKKYQEQGTVDTFPTVEEIQFNTAPQRLAVAIDRMIQNFGTPGTDAANPASDPTAGHAHVNLCDELLTLTSNMLEKAETAADIRHWQNSRIPNGENGEQ